MIRDAIEGMRFLGLAWGWKGEFAVYEAGVLGRSPGGLKVKGSRLDGTGKDGW